MQEADHVDPNPETNEMPGYKERPSLGKRVTYILHAIIGNGYDLGHEAAHGDVACFVYGLRYVFYVFLLQIGYRLCAWLSCRVHSQ